MQKKIYSSENVLFDVVSKTGLDGLVGNKSTTGELVGIEIHGGIKQGGLVKRVYVPEGGEPRNHRINKTDMKTFCFTSVL